MNEEKLRIAIAEALGWEVEWGILDEHLEFFCGIPPYPSKNESGRDDFPDWLTSRDAAIEAVIELVKTDEQKSALIFHLNKAVGQGHYVRWNFEACNILTATPLQICLALVKALNLNVEE